MLITRYFYLKLSTGEDYAERLWRLCVTTSFPKTRIESINLLYIYRDTQAFYTDETSALHVFPSGYKASIRANGI